MIFKDVLSSIKKNKEIREGGGWVGIPYPFGRLSEYIPFIERGHSIGILAGTGVGKSKFTRFVFLYHVYKFYKETGYKVKIFWFPLEDNTVKVYHNLICNYLFDRCGIDISVQELKSQKRILPEFVLEKIEEAEEYFAELEKIVEFKDDIHTPSGIFAYLKKYARETGVTKNRIKEDGSKEPYYTSDIHTIVVIDNMSNLETEDDCPTEREAMIKLAKNYIREKLCNFLNFTVVQVLQLAFDKERQQYTNTGMSIISKLEPSLDGVGDAKTITRSMHLVLGLFNPSRYELVSYPIPPKNEPDNCYRIDILGNRFRALKVIKSNDSDVGMRIGLLFNAFSETFSELPLPKTPELKNVYESLTGKKFSSLNNNVTFAAQSVSIDEEDDEPPF